MQVQASQTTNTYIDYAKTVLKAISELEQKVNALYADKDKLNARSVIYSDYSVTISNGSNLSVTYTYNSLPTNRKNNLRYTNLFLRVFLVGDQNIYTLPENNFFAVKNVLNINFGKNCYVKLSPTNTPSPILSNQDFIGERMLPISRLTAEHLANGIEDLVSHSQHVQKHLVSQLSAERGPMPPSSNKSMPVAVGVLPIDNFERLGQVAWARIGEWKMVQSEFSAQFPVSYAVSIYNNTAGTLSNFPPACRIQYSGDKILLGTDWIFPCIPFESSFFTPAYTVNFLSQFQNTASRILPTANGNYALNFDATYYGELLSSSYGITVFNEITATSPGQLATSAVAFYLSSRI